MPTYRRLAESSEDSPLRTGTTQEDGGFQINVSFFFLKLSPLSRSNCIHALCVIMQYVSQITPPLKNIFFIV